MDPKSLAESRPPWRKRRSQRLPSFSQGIPLLLEHPILLRRPSSSRSSAVRPSFSPASISIRLTHFLNESADTPNSWAVPETGPPEERTGRTASLWNSGWQGVWFSAPPLRGRSPPNLYLSTEMMQSQSRLSRKLRSGPPPPNPRDAVLVSHPRILPGVVAACSIRHDALGAGDRYQR